jgi:uncharacterized protein (DUF302 family)
MTDYGRRIVIDSGFEAAVDEVSRAVRNEGMQTIARIDVRGSFWRDLARDFRRYVLIEAWSPDLAFDAVRNDLDVGTIFPATFAIYELADGETAIMAKEPLAPMAVQPDWRGHSTPDLIRIADRQTECVARVLERLQHAASHESAAPAA